MKIVKEEIRIQKYIVICVNGLKGSWIINQILYWFLNCRLIFFPRLKLLLYNSIFFQ